MKILREAFDSAAEQEDPNPIVSVSAWPLGVLCDYGDHDELARETNRLIGIIEKESHPIRRADGLFLVLKFTRQGPWNVVKCVLDAFRSACEAGHGWKRDRDLRDASEWIAPRDHEEALRLVELIEQPRVRRQALRKFPAR